MIIFAIGRRPLQELPGAVAEGLTLMVDSIYNGQRFQDLWLDH